MEEGRATIKLTEKALREAEEKWRSLVENAPERISILDRDGTILFINRVTPGFSAEEIVGTNIFKLAPDEKNRLKEALESAFRSKELQKYEGTFKGADGTKVWVENSLVPIRRGDQITSVILLSVDITERRRAEEALRKSENRLQTLFKTMAEGVIMIGPDGRIVEANPAAESILGVTRSEVRSSNFAYPDWEAIRTDGTPMPLSEMPSAIAMARKRPVKDVVIGIKRGDGTLSWINVSSVPLAEEADRPAGVVTTFGDITERKNAEEEVRRYSQYLENIFAASPLAVTVNDPSGIIIKCNQAALDLHGFSSKDEMLGVNLFTLVAEKEHKRVRGGLKETVEKGLIENIQLTMLHKDGHEFPGELSGSVIKDPSGRPTAFVAVIKDITERKKAEEALHASEEHYRVLVENSNEAIVVAQDSMLKFVNTKTAEITGYSKDELTAKPFKELIHPDDRKKVVKRHQERLKGEKIPHIYLFRIVCKEGNIKWVEINAVKIKWGGRYATLNLIKDITEQKMMQE